MYTIEEVKLSRPNSTYQIAAGATREFDREDIIRELESGVQAAHAHQTKIFGSTIRSIWQKLIGGAFSRTQSTGKSLPA